MNYPKAVLSLITGPIRTESSGGREILTHLQKYSRFGFLMTYPFCFHFWLFWKLQEYRYPQVMFNGQIQHVHGLGEWVPGPEQGIYFRTPGWRWDIDLGMIWTWGYFGLHWD